MSELGFSTRALAVQLVTADGTGIMSEVGLIACEKKLKGYEQPRVFTGAIAEMTPV